MNHHNDIRKIYYIYVRVICIVENKESTIESTEKKSSGVAEWSK